MSLIPARPALRALPVAVVVVGGLVAGGCGSTDDARPAAATHAPAVRSALAERVPGDAVALGEVQLRPTGSTRAGLTALADALGLPRASDAERDHPTSSDHAHGPSDHPRATAYRRTLRREILPTLGDHAGGFVLAGKGLHAAALAEVRDPAALRRVLARELPHGRTVQSGGQKITVVRTKRGERAVWVGARTVAAGSPHAVREAASVTPHNSLAGSPRFTGALAQVRAVDPAAVGWVDGRLVRDATGALDVKDLGRVGRVIGLPARRQRMLATVARAALPSLRRAGRTAAGSTVAFALEPRPGRMRVVAGGTGPRPGAGEATAAPGAQALAALPAGSWAAVGLDLSDRDGSPSAGGSETRASKAATRAARKLGLPGLDGRLPARLRRALSHVTSAGVAVRGDSLLAANGAVVLRTTDARAAHELLSALRSAAEDGGRLHLTDRAAPGVQDGVIGRLRSLPIQIAAAVKDDRVAIGLGPDAVGRALAPKTTLVSGEGYRRAKEALGGIAPSVVLDPAPVRKLLAGLPLKGILPAGLDEALGRIGLITAGSASTGPTTWHGAFAVTYRQPSTPPKH